MACSIHQLTLTVSICLFGFNPMTRLVAYSKVRSLLALILCILCIGISKADTNLTWSVTNQTGKETLSFGFEQVVYLTVSDEFTDWFQSQKSAVHPYINGMVVDKSTLTPLKASENIYSFFLPRDSVNADLWRVLRSRKSESKWLERDVLLSFGVADKLDENMQFSTVRLVLSKGLRNTVAFIVLAALSLVFLIACYKSNILRHGPLPPGSNRKPPLSLARSQMALWLFVAISCFLFIWIISGSVSSINETALILLGISSATFLGAAIIESNDHSNDHTGDAGTVHTGIASTKNQKPVRKKEQRALMQLLSDNNGVSLHRFQIFSWTLVLVCIFLFEVFKNLQMPDYSATLLGVMGISSGTYLGFKFPELQQQDSK